MTDFTINEMQEMQKELQDKYKNQWEPVSPETGRNKLLWMIGEIGEVIDIIKKHGDLKAISDAELRKELVEEMADVLIPRLDFQRFRSHPWSRSPISEDVTDGAFPRPNLGRL